MNAGASLHVRYASRLAPSCARSRAQMQDRPPSQCVRGCPCRFKVYMATCVAGGSVVSKASCVNMLPIPSFQSFHSYATLLGCSTRLICSMEGS
eukprot:5047957-Amphidinium_carterae.3